MELKGRLGAIAEKIPQCVTLADIGTDHAYIPLYAVQNSICSKAIAADVNSGPVEIALRNIKRFGYEEFIDTRLGYGLEPLKVYEADVVVIAGMGGILIQEIISKSYEKAQAAKVLILQPMNMIEALRKWLYEKGFEIIEETLTEDSKKIYNILSVKWTGKTSKLDDFYYYIGYELSQRKDTLFKRYAMNKLNLLKKKIDGMRKAVEQSDELEKLFEIKYKLEALLLQINKEGIMTIKCGNIISFMDQLAPASLAENWDNVGLILGSRGKEVKKILLCLDVTADVVEEALKSYVQLIISHHPLIFKKLGRINEDDYKGSLLYKLIKAGISVFCAHTNLDIVECGVNRKLAERLELSDISGLKNFEDTIVDIDCEKNPSAAGSSPGLGAVGYHTAGLSLEEFVSFLKEKLEVDRIRMVGQVKGRVGKVAVYCGSFDDDLETVILQKADILVTGDLKYHTAVDALGMGMCIIDAGHFNTEKIILPALEKLLKAEFPELHVICSKMAADPFNTY